MGSATSDICRLCSFPLSPSGMPIFEAIDDQSHLSCSTFLGFCSRLCPLMPLSSFPFHHACLHFHAIRCLLSRFLHVLFQHALGARDLVHGIHLRLPAGRLERLFYRPSGDLKEGEPRFDVRLQTEPPPEDPPPQGSQGWELWAEISSTTWMVRPLGLPQPPPWSGWFAKCPGTGLRPRHPAW